MTMNAADWIDTYPADALPQLRQVLDRSAYAVRYWYALLDMGFLPALRGHLADLYPQGRVIALYEGVYDGEDLLAISPCLVALPVDAQQRAAVCAGLLRHTDGRPMLSVLHTAYEMDALAAHLRRQFEARATDDEAFLVRYADTRCLPLWAGVLSEQQRARFFAGLDSWWYFDREAALTPLRIDARAAMTEADAQADDPYLIDPQQMAVLRRAAKIDTLIFHIRQRPESFGVLMATPSQVHATVSAVWTNDPDLPGAAARAALDALANAGMLVPLETHGTLPVA
ncbi:DUF4123 domain-containing protein [Paraburkholderia silviterrae]|uniref:DUF4123 domain-containing protein n=1 Tax=Paraburkholderia silviterrae TaxID=2528715 RepID=A0A4R5LYA7_9BURK|nr:DUF4123 domain-containing protein [Paraburkholderia silviterrae]TDG16959.1 DUF4123 domain-containing protein [Paraburkholderia silviterrae]